MSKEVLDKVPTYGLEDLTKHDGEFGAIREKSYTYFDVKRDWEYSFSPARRVRSARAGRVFACFFETI
jgi:hypothetical protein